MATFLAVGIYAVTSAGVEKIKNRRAAKKKAKQELAEQEARERYFQSHKSQEAEEERQQAEEELLAAQPSSSRAAAVRGVIDAPPPYVKDAPDYEEHYRDARVVNGVAGMEADHPALQQQPQKKKHTPRPGETEEEMRKRLRKEYFRRGDYFTLVGVSIASGC